MGYDNNALSAAIVNLAVKGYLSISNDDDDYVLQRTQPTETLAPGETVLFSKLFAKGASLVLDNRNHAIVSAARRAHKSALRRDYQNTYFLANTGKLWPSLIGSVVIVGLIIYLGAISIVSVGLLLVNLVVHIVFIFLLKAPTSKGRALMDKLEG